MANKNLTAKLRLDTSQAETALKNLANKMRNINATANKMAGASTQMERLTNQTKQQVLYYSKLAKTATIYQESEVATERVRQQSLNTLTKTDKVAQKMQRHSYEQWWATQKTGTQLQRVVTKTQEWWNKQKGVTNATRSTNSALSSVWSKLKGIAATYLGIMGGRALINTSDTITAAQNKLNYIGSPEQTQETMDKMYNSAQKVRMSYTDMMSNVSKTMALAGDAFNNNIDNAIRFQEIMAEAYAVGGASAAEMSTSMYQLTQALGAGILAGDELRSVREGAPLAYQEIEKFVQGVYNTEESLKDLASQGKVTSDMVVAAIMAAGNKMDEAFAQTQVLFSQFWTQVKNAATKAFSPVANAMREMLNDALDNGLIAKIESFFTEVSKGLQIMFALFERGVNWVAENWYWLEGILLKGIITIGIMMAGMAVYAAAKWLVMNWALIAVGAVIYWLIGVFNSWRNGAVETCDIIQWAIIALGAVILAVAAKVTLGWLVAWGVMTAGTAWAILGIIALIVILAAAIFQRLDFVCGIVWSAGAFIYNVFAGVMHGIIQALYAITEPIVGVIEWLVNAWNLAFTDIGGAFNNFCGQLLAGLIGLLKPFAALLDKVFGWDINGAISSAQSFLRGVGKTDAAVTYTVDEISGLDRIDITDAFANGSEWGATAKNNINEWGSSVADKVNGILGSTAYDVDDAINEKLAMKNGTTSFMDNLADALGVNVTEPNYGSGGGLNSSSAEDILGDIADNTGLIADSMALTEEDLKYLRDVANMEWKREYTTANITIDMTNNNNISKDVDADQLYRSMMNRLEEETFALANGAY